VPSVLLAFAVAAVAALMTVMARTALGARRRGRGPLLAVVAGLLFPVTWIVWYVRDKSPLQRRA
jgi:ABC-type polysaccharide/polyol phosphate export permease